ncbi:MAG: leucine--tRNA ligase [Prevotellaceae bacterium]|jgi:leucyl-tRNA synthetase|nr:leucine--tRNA ligase [Prevotellaceae bacterium]
MDYSFKEIEKKWQRYWIENATYKVTENPSKPKYYVLDMFPYPSGAGLHVGHPLGYIASDIFARYKRLKGFNVLHPMGYDAYGLPAEQYAIQTGQHPAVTTEQNIKRYREQLDKIGFSFDWSREVRTCEPEYYKWTQWAFIKMFNSVYCNLCKKALPIENIISVFEECGTEGLNLACSEPMTFTAEFWKSRTEKEQQEILMNYRIAYLADTMVNWCPQLGTVLANDEVINGVSERGGYPVEQRKMRQWCLRVSAYSQRLLDGLEKIDWTESLKETQRNWIGRSEGAEIRFYLSPDPSPQERGEIPENPSREMLENPKGWFKNTTDENNWKFLINIAKDFRSNQTEAENELWQAIRAKKIGYKIRRQHIVDGFIADFINLEKQVIIEVDGGIHLTTEQKERDKQRTAILNQFGFEVIRFTNEEIFDNVQNVALKIKDYLDKVPSKRTATTPLSCGEGSGERSFVVFTTRPDTIFGVTFMVLAPESEYVSQVVTPEQKSEVDTYLDATKKRTERERQADRKVTGVFTGSYAINPANGVEIPIWISDYVLAGYGTGAIMAVPAHDSRDYAFAKHFNLPIIPLIEGADVSEESFDAKEGTMINSGFLNGLTVKEAIKKAKEYIAENNLGKVKVNYRLRDAIFSRQRYWGEPFPIYYKDGMPYTVALEDLPIELPEVDKFLPTETGEPPLGRAKNWKYEKYPLELNTMPGFAGSSAYYLRYEDPHNDNALVSREANDYWGNVDLYLGGTEHATGHLIYSRFWNKFLFDLGIVGKDEPFQKLINQGMIQGRSNFVYRVKNTNTFVSYNLENKYDTTEIHVDVNIVSNDVLDIEKFRAWRPEFADAEFILEDGKYVCGYAVEKMSKSMFNVVNPDDIVEKYGADTLRMYEMFLGPLEQSKPWDTNGIDGVHRFLKRLWGLFYKGDEFVVTDEPPTAEELKALHKIIKKTAYDIEHFSFNTSISAFMICVNELATLKCSKRAILEPLVIVLSPFAPHIAEELYHALGNTTTVCDAQFPEYDEKYLAESSVKYPVSFNGKVRFTLDFPADTQAKEVEKSVLENEQTAKFLEGKEIKKVIVVPGKIVNIVF